jgi:hypothetical protein
MQTQFKNYIQNSYFKTSAAGELTNEWLKHSRGTQHPQSRKLHFLEENDSAVKPWLSIWWQEMIMAEGGTGRQDQSYGSHWERMARLSGSVWWR